MRDIYLDPAEIEVHHYTVLGTRSASLSDILPDAGRRHATLYVSDIIAHAASHPSALDAQSNAVVRKLVQMVSGLMVNSDSDSDSDSDNVDTSNQETIDLGKHDPSDPILPHLDPKQFVEANGLVYRQMTVRALFDGMRNVALSELNSLSQKYAIPLPATDGPAADKALTRLALQYIRLGNFGRPPGEMMTLPGACAYIVLGSWRKVCSQAG